MADPKQLPPASEEERVTLAGGATYFYGRVDHNYNETRRNIVEMSPTAADAMKAVARSQFEVPAQEATKQEIQRTQRAKQETWRLAIVGACVLAACFVIYTKPETGWPLATLLAIFGGAVAAPKIIEKAKEKKSLPPSE